jgi:dienelactone hydrolase
LPLINSFKSALDADGITNQIQIYKELGHAFANPSGANYAPQQTADSWDKTLAFISFLRICSRSEESSFLTFSDFRALLYRS